MGLTEGDWAAFDDFFEEVIALVVDDDECREVLNFDFPDCFHAQFGVLEYLDGFDAVLGQSSGWSAD
jgi:hypothetical protein